MFNAHVTLGEPRVRDHPKAACCLSVAQRGNQPNAHFTLKMKLS